MIPVILPYDTKPLMTGTRPASSSKLLLNDMHNLATMGAVHMVASERRGKTWMATAIATIAYETTGNTHAISAAPFFPSIITRVFLPCDLSASWSGNVFTKRTVDDSTPATTPASTGAGPRLEVCTK